MSHGDKVTQMPRGFTSIATSENTSIAAMADEKLHYYGLQFHPEVAQSEYGQAIIKIL